MSDDLPAREPSIARRLAGSSFNWVNRNRSAALVPVLLGLSVLFTFWREIVFASLYGAGRELDIFRIAYSLPNLFSLGVSPSFVAAIMSVLARYERKGIRQFEAVYRKIHLFNGGVVLAIVAIGILTAYLQAVAQAPGLPAKYMANLTRDIAINWVMFFFVGVTFSVRARQTMEKIYWPNAATNAIRAGIFVPCLLILAMFVPLGAMTSWMASIVALLSGLGVYFAHWLGTPRRMRARIAVGRKVAAKVDISYWRLLSLLGTAVAVTFIYSLTRFIDRGYATTLGVGAVSASEYSISIVTALGILLGTTFNTITVADVARAGHRRTDYRDLVKFAMSMGSIVALCFVIGAVCAYWSDDIVVLLFRRGSFDAHAVHMTSAIFQYQIAGLPASVLGAVLIQALIALEVRTGLIVIMSLKVALKAALIALLAPQFHIAAIGISFIITEIFATLGLMALFAWALVGKPKPQT